MERRQRDEWDGSRSRPVEVEENKVSPNQRLMQRHEDTFRMDTSPSPVADFIQVVFFFQKYSEDQQEDLDAVFFSKLYKLQS